MITKVSKVDIISGNTDRHKRARYILCYIVRNGYPHLMKNLSNKIILSESAIHKYARKIELMSYEDQNTERLLKTSAQQLNVRMPKPMKADGDTEFVESPNTVKTYPKWNPFDLTEEDELRIHWACVDAANFMNKMCSIGRKPIAEGMVYSTTPGRRHTYESWYR